MMFKRLNKIVSGFYDLTHSIRQAFEIFSAALKKKKYF